MQVRAEITDLQKDFLLAEVLERTEDGRPSSKISVAMGLLKKRDRLEFALEKLTELGVHQVILFEGDHSERSHIRADRLEGIVQSALKQSLGSWLPDLHIVDSLEEIFQIQGEDPMEAIYLADETMEDGVSTELSHLEGTSSVKDLGRIPHRLLIIGPEGGFSKRERAWMDANLLDCKAISLGKRRLRAETAAIAGLLSLQLRA